MRKSIWLAAMSIAFTASVVRAEQLNGLVKIDGSSTVFPIIVTATDAFKKDHSVKFAIGIAGTTGGLKRFATGDIEIATASRPIKSEEHNLAIVGGHEYLELPIAYDGLSVVVNVANDNVSSLTMHDLKRIWEPGSKVKTWQDLNAKWTSQPLDLYSPGPMSGTYDYFTEEVVGRLRSMRSDVTSSEDDAVLVRGISANRNAIGYFGFAYYAQNRAKMKLVAIDAGEGPITPSDETIGKGTYPLARPLFIYVSKRAAERKEVEAFVAFFVERAAAFVKESGYHPLTPEAYQETLKVFKERRVGSRFISGRG